jgi:gamma-glutamylcysteine synthetase
MAGYLKIKKNWFGFKWILPLCKKATPLNGIAFALLY